ncbi:MAG TPA: helix-turn-helix domain-containing protein [Ktedonobacterales bacterium]|nr:helix-turn-helix domain-containing protein [Ktedonobacterales bacterium]
MPQRYHLELSVAQAQDLRDLRDHATRAYLRERAAVVLAIAAGASIRQAARTAGLKPHKADSACRWLHRYQAEGRQGLMIRKGRGRKPASFPAGARRRARGGASGGRATTGALRAGTEPLVARRPAPVRAVAARLLPGHRLADAAPLPPGV